ncbi:MAG: TonB-dependent receptor [Bacteroidales bacterium]|nr:TonB-dependent receptor [Bacteroidales bacterium]
MKKIFFIIGLVFFSFNLFSQVDSSNINLFDMNLEDLMNLKISSVSKADEELFEAPQTIIVITQDEIFKRGYTDLEQVFHDLPGFDISRGNGTQYSQIYQRGYRSNNTERTSFQIDGVEENDLWSNSVWLSRQYPLSNIKRIEIIYGPASTMYGANAFVGVVNIVTKDAEDIVKGKSFGVNASGGYGNWNTWYSDVTIAGKYNNASLVLTGRIFRSDEMDLSGYNDWDYNLDNYDENYYSGILGTTNQDIILQAMQYDNNAYFNDLKLNGIVPTYSNNTNDWLINAKLKISDFTIGYQIFKREEGYGAWYRDDFELGPKNGGVWTPINSFLYTKYTKQITENISFTNFNSFKVHKLDGSCEEYYYIGYLNGELGLSDIADSIGNILPDSLQTRSYWWRGWYHTYSQQLRSESRMNYTPSKNFNLIIGFQYRASLIQGQYVVSEEPNPEQTAPPLETLLGGNHFFSRDLGGFFQAKYSPLKNLSFVIGGRIDNNKIRVNQGYKTQFNPKAAIIFKPNTMVLKAIYSEAFMDAGYWTKYGTTPARLLNNPNLEPEKVKNIEFVWGWKLNYYLYTEITAYRAFYNGTVGTASVTFNDPDGNIVNTTQHQAIGKLNIQGIQSRILLKLKTYSFYANYTFTNPYKINEDNSKTRIGDIASHSANFGINALFFSKLNLNLRMNIVGEKLTGENTTISNNPYDKIDPYWILNGAITYNIFRNMFLQISSENIFNTEYFSPGVRSANGTYYAAKIPQNERMIRGSLIIKM